MFYFILLSQGGIAMSIYDVYDYDNGVRNIEPTMEKYRTLIPDFPDLSLYCKTY